MIKLALLFLCFFRFSFAAQAESQNGSLAEAAKKLAVEIANKESLNPALLLKLNSAWQKKCAARKSSEPCFLSETLILGKQGRLGYNLLFRGESGRYALPGTSIFLRHILEAPSAFCDSKCSYEQLNSKLQFEISNLLLNPISIMANTVLTYFESTASWMVLRGNQGQHCDPKDLTQPIPVRTLAECDPAVDRQGQMYSDSLSRHKPLDLLVQAHKSSSDHFLIRGQDGKSDRFDALVSFSTSPQVAGEFAGDEGRVIIISVPAEKMKGNKVNDCENLNLKSDEVLMTQKCLFLSRDEDYVDESEVDYLYLMNPSHLLAVMTKK